MKYGSAISQDNYVDKGVVPARGEHSRKPDEIYEHIEALALAKRHPGWDAWGNEVNKFGGAL
jgi:N6-adenosine-specific RNA methylase IME4